MVKIHKNNVTSMQISVVSSRNTIKIGRVTPHSPHNTVQPMGDLGLTIQCSIMCTDMVWHATQEENSIEDKITVTPLTL